MLHFLLSSHSILRLFAAPVGNGGRTDTYWWTQTLSEVNVMLNLPADTKGRDVDVAISTDKLRVQWKGALAPIIDVIIQCCHSAFYATSYLCCRAT
jgi:hypothetical protein